MFETKQKTFGIHLDVESFLKNTSFPHGFAELLTDGEGRELSPYSAREALRAELAKGHKVIPCSGECGNPCQHVSNGCSGFGYGGGGCPGRYHDAT
jgi:hypothetical protein